MHAYSAALIRLVPAACHVGATGIWMCTKDGNMPHPVHGERGMLLLCDEDEGEGPAVATPNFHVHVTFDSDL
jgi:hypothetical protein